MYVCVILFVFSLIQNYIQQCMEGTTHQQFCLCSVIILTLHTSNTAHNVSGYTLKTVSAYYYSICDKLYSQCSVLLYSSS